MRIPIVKPAVAASPAQGEYDLEHQAEFESTRFQPSTLRRNDAAGIDRESQPVRKQRRKRSKTRRADSRFFLARRRNLIILAAIVGVVALVATFVPGVRAPIGVALALPGVLLCLYGYASGAYIAFTEDDLHGWLYLLFPFYAAYYLVSRWDDMSSRLIMVVLGLVLAGIGGRMLEGEVVRAIAAKTDAAAKS
jgi:hypothetical protein